MIAKICWSVDQERLLLDSADHTVFIQQQIMLEEWVTSAFQEGSTISTQVVFFPILYLDTSVKLFPYTVQ